MPEEKEKATMSRWTADLRWDGETHKEEIIKVLLDYITGAEKHQALITSYGDLAILLKKNHNNTGSVRSNYTIETMAQGIEISLTPPSGKYVDRVQLTWNQTAKLISKRLNEIAGK